MLRLTHKFLIRLALLSALALLFSLGLVSVQVQSAAASIRQMEEAPGQVLYQSRHTLRDQAGNSWQVVLFKRIKGGEITHVNLRLVGFPGMVELSHPQALEISLSQGKVLQAVDRFAQEAPAPNVGEYDFTDILPDLRANQSTTLILPLAQERSLSLQVPPPVVIEWQELAKS